MIIGNFNYDAAHDTYRGDLVTLSFAMTGLLFQPNKKVNDREPDYRVVIESDTGTIEVGAAWERTSEKGQAFLSVSLDSPLLAAPFNAALFPGVDGTGASLVWTRQKPKAKPAASDKKVA